MRRDPWNTRRPGRERYRPGRRRTRAEWPAPEWGHPYARHPHPAAVAARLTGRALAGYARWVARNPETRGLGTALGALYPAGEIAHLAAADPLMLAAFAPPAALATAVGTHKAHHSAAYTAAAAALAAGVPAWLATAAATGITSLPVALGYSAAACAGWSAITWSDVLRHRRAAKAQQVKWATMAAGTGLDGSRLLKAEQTRTGWRFRIDIRACGKTASQLASRDLAERIAAVLGLPAERVRVLTDHSHAGVILVTVQTMDPWAHSVPHPALAAGYTPARRSIMDGPLVVGENPDTGEPLGITAYDDGGAWHTFVMAPTGSGKTTLYSNLLEQATACVDVLVWPIDLRKGTIPFYWHPALDFWAGLDADGSPQYDRALAILTWGAALIKLRSAANGGANHVPTPADPAIIIPVDEMDTLVGADSPIAHLAKPLVSDIHRGGRSAGIELIMAGQRGVVAYTGSKDPHANAGNKVVLRVNRSAEMNNVLPDWEADGMPDMHSYAPGVSGVALLVDPGSRWAAGRVRDLSDLKAVGQLAAARGKPTAALPAGIAARLPGYNDRHQAPAAGGGAAVVPLPTRPPAASGQPAAAGHLAVVHQLTHDLPATVAARLAGMPTPPAEATGLADLIAARAAIDAAETSTPAANRAIPIPPTITGPLLAFLGERGDAGARRDEIVAHLGKSRSWAAKWLAITRDHGLIAVSGATSAARYYLPEHAPDAGTTVDTDASDDDVA